MSEATDTYGPRGTYGCACVSRNAKVCMLVRYGYAYLDADERCECLCHQWDDDDDVAVPSSGDRREQT